MRFRAFGDVMADKATTRKVIGSELPEVEFLLFTGDIPNPEIFKILREQKVLSGETRERELKDEIESEDLLAGIAAEVREINRVFGEMTKTYEVYGVLGNADLRKFLLSIPVEETIQVLHKKVVRVDDYYLVGYNGRPLYQFEEENRDENAFSEEEIYNDLSALLGQIDNSKVVLVTHAPPYGILDQVKPKYREYAVGTYGERAKEGHIGSVGLRKIVDEFKPKLHVFGHIHECKGVHIGENTIFINVGSLGEDGGFVDITLKEEGVDAIFGKV